MIEGTLAGGHVSFRKAKQTILQIQQLAKKEKVVYIPSHDSQGAERLRRKQRIQI